MTTEQLTDYPNALSIGSELMEYRIEAILGVGGFGITYLARDTHLDKAVAIKEYFPGGAVARGGNGDVTLTSPEVASDYDTGLERFLREARTLAGFSHPHIVRVNRYFKAHATGYMVMDYEDGQSLKSWLKRNPMPDEEILKSLLAPLLDGLEKVHASGFLHRDIKPDNIFVRARGDPVLIDFGSARQAAASTQALTTMVTPGYAPLEQYSADSPQGPATDIYALGAVLFYAITGKSPPDAVSRMNGDTVGAFLAPAAERYSPMMLEAIRWAMSMMKAHRPQNLTEWRETLYALGPRPMGAGVAPEAAATKADAHPSPTQSLTSDIGRMLEDRERLERAMKEKFQRVLTVMFTDLKGSTAIAESSGDMAVRAMLKRYHDLCQQAITAQGGTLVKTIGDGSLSHFVDALPACRAAAAIQRGMEEINISKQYKSLLLARIGMHTGECILEKNDVFGDVVNTASRFESAANPGEIFISEDTYTALSDKSEFYTRFDREVTLKGKSMPFRGYIVFWDPKEIERDRATPVAPAKPPTPAWKLGLVIGVPLLIVLAVAAYITAGNKVGGEERRSINFSVPGK
ncbi:MAG: adenylate/guanylate cyclase domain-containing protein [Usitatibacter sp.]